MKRTTAILIGAGNRGRRYTDYGADLFGSRFSLVGVAEPDDEKRNAVQKKHGISDADCVTDWRDLFNRPKFADLAVIATQDRDHFAPAMAAIEKGYDLLLEKPMAPTPQECAEIAKAAREKGVFVLVCHVLRYTPFFRMIKQILDNGEIGQPVNVLQVEGVGNRHFSHSYVRGNWCNTAECAPMILTKSCHDVDILQWLVGKKCLRVQSFGSLSYFTHANCPSDAPLRCIDGCPHSQTCPYDAVRIYLREHGFSRQATGMVNPTDEDIERILRETPYGICVFQSRNDVADHQTVNLEFEDGITASLTVSAFNEGGRTIRIMGTKGELNARMNGETVSVYDYLSRKTREVRVEDYVADETITGGHGGGDRGIVKALLDYLQDPCRDKIGEGLSNASISAENHMLAFAAEESRLTGKVIDVAEYTARFMNR